MDREKELEHIKFMLMENRYPGASVEIWSKQIRTIKGEQQDEGISTVRLPYVKGLSEAVARIPQKVQI